MANRELRVNVIVDSSGAIRSLKGLDDAAMSTAETIGRRFQSVGEGMSRVGRQMSVGITLPLVAAGGALARAGINARESEDLFRVSFGNMAHAARSWSESTSDAMQSSAFAFREQSALLFTMVQSMGVGREAAFEMSTGVIELARDLESFFNLAEGEGFAKLRSGLTGEIEPLKQLGITFNAAEVQAKAFEMGLASTAAELTEGDRLLARYQLILERTSTAQGNAALTAASEANQLRALKAEFGDAARELGVALLPLMSDMLAIAKDTIPFIQGMVRWFTSLSPTMQRVAVGGTAVAAALGPVLAIFGPLVGAIGAALPVIASVATGLAAFASGPVLLVGAALATLAGIWVTWGEDIKRIVADTFTAVQDWMVGRFGAVVDSVKSKVEAVTGFFGDMFDAVVGNSFVPDMVDEIGRQADRMDSVFTSVMEASTGGVQAAFSGLSTFLSQDFMPESLRTIGGWATSVINTIDGVVRSVQTAVGWFRVLSGASASANTAAGVGGGAAAGGGIGLGGIAAVAGPVGVGIGIAAWLANTNRGAPPGPGQPQQFGGSEDEENPDYYPHGGLVRGSGRNHIPIFAQPGEFVMSRAATSRLGVSALSDLNSGGAGGINITVNVAGSIRSDRDLAEVINRELVRRAGHRRILAGVMR